MRKKAKHPGVLASLGLSFLAVGLLSCRGASEQDSQTKIYGGLKSKAGAWPSTVAITVGDRVYCSGTAIHPQIVITAAHCVEHADDPSSLGIYVGEGAEGGQVMPQYSVVKALYSPRYGRNTDGWNDMAYVMLDKPLQLPASAYIPVLTDQAEIAEVLQEGLKSYVVGFGSRDGGGYGVKYEVEVDITKVSDNEVYLGHNGKDSCQGDSGGPAYVQLRNGAWRVYGVVSRGGACGSGGIYGRMNANICWVQEDSGVDLGLADYCKN